MRKEKKNEVQHEECKKYHNKQAKPQEKKRSGAMRIFEALSLVDEELLERSDNQPKEIPFWKYSKTMAACICFVVLGAALFVGNQLFFTKNETSSDCAMSADTVQNEKGMETETEADMDTGNGFVGNEKAAPVVDAAAADTSKEGAAQEEVQNEILAETEGMKEDEQSKSQLDTEGIKENAASNHQSTTANVESSQMVQGSTMDSESEIECDMGIPRDTREALAEEELRAIENIGEYIPTSIPSGYRFESGYQNKKEDTGEGIGVLWTKGMDTIHLSIREYEASAEIESRIVDISKPETYDVHLYEIPYCDSVPDEFYLVFHYPIFVEKDFSLEVIRMRMKSVADKGDTNTPRGNFGVLYDSGILIEFIGDGEAESIWKMFESIKP